MNSVNEISDNIFLKSMFKQSFCYHVEKTRPEVFKNIVTCDLAQFLDRSKRNLDDDKTYGLILCGYLSFPHYFSYHDYNIILNEFDDLDQRIKKRSIQKCIGMLFSAVRSIVKYDYGKLNLKKFINRCNFNSQIFALLGILELEEGCIEKINIYCRKNKKLTKNNVGFVLEI